MSGFFCSNYSNHILTRMNGVVKIVIRYIDASSLMSVMVLPESFVNRKLEVLVFPIEEQEAAKKKVDVELVVYYSSYEKNKNKL